MKYFILIFFLLPMSVSGQWKYKYKSEYESGIQFDMLGVSRGIAASYNRVLFNGKYGFTSSSIGLSFVSGQKGRMFYQSGVGIPLSLSYNHSLGQLDKRVKNALSRKCIIKPSKLNLEWFLEGGGGISPIFYEKLPNEVVYSGYLGLRIQSFLPRPFDNVVFFRMGYSPFYRTVKREEGIYFDLRETGALSYSIGVSI